MSLASQLQASAPVSRPAPAINTARGSRERWRRERAVPCLRYVHRGRKRDIVLRHGVVTGRAEGMAPRLASGGEPAPAHDAVPLNGFRGIVGARRQKSTRSSEVWGNTEFIGAKRHQGDAN